LTQKIKTDQNPLSIWFIHDDRPGHLNQLHGLSERLSAHHKIITTWLDANLNQVSWLEAFLKKTNKTEGRTPPDIIIGAGHKTHKVLLFNARAHHAFSVVLMKPSLPLSFFDAIICPKHDKLKESNRVLNTCGALNKVTPASHLTQKTKHLMLIGGPSKHFEWQAQPLVAQIQAICRKHTDKEWLLSNSPRTPSSFMTQLMKLNIPNLCIYHYQDNNLEDLDSLLQQCAAVWITPDSVSMVYESLTARAPSFLFNMSPSNKHKPTRVARSILDLIQEQHVSSFQDWQSNSDIKAPTIINLWEADRAAQWLLNQYFEQRPGKREYE